MKHVKVHLVNLILTLWALGYYRERLHVKHFQELKGQSEPGITSKKPLMEYLLAAAPQWQTQTIIILFTLHSYILRMHVEYFYL